MSELMTVKQFAAVAGVSPQRIYQRLDTNLKSFVKVVNGHKMLSTEGLQLFEIHPLEQDLHNPLQTLEQDLESLQAENRALKSENTVLKGSIQELEQDLEKEREKSTKMTAENAVLTKKIKGLEQDLAKAIDKTIETQNALDTSNLDRTKTEIRLNAKVQELEHQAAAVQSQLTDKGKQLAELKADKDKLNARLDKAEEERAELIKSNNNLTTALQAAQALHGMDKQQAVIEVQERPPASSETSRTTSEPRPVQRHQSERQQRTKSDNSFLSFLKNRFQRKQ